MSVTCSSSFRSSRQRCFVKEGVFKNFTKFTGKHLCQSLFFDKDGEFCVIFKKNFYTELLRVNASVIWKLLKSYTTLPMSL